MSALDSAAVKASVNLEGFCWKEDAQVGSKVVQFLEDGLPFDSATGLMLVQQNILNQPVIRGVLETTFEKSFFSFFRGYGHHRGQAYTLSRNHGHGDCGGCLAIQLWMRSSEAIFYGKSHQASLPAKPSANGLLEISETSIVHPIVNRRVVMPEGGWAITDSRCAFTIEKGFVIVVVFATKALIDVWKTQMIFPDVPAVREKIKEMEDEKIGLNIELQASH